MYIFSALLLNLTVEIITSHTLSFDNCKLLLVISEIHRTQIQFIEKDFYSRQKLLLNISRIFHTFTHMA